MKKIETLIVVLLTLLGMSSCSNELSDAGGVDPSSGMEVTLSLRSAPASVLTGGTGMLSRSTDPSSINDGALQNAWILQFINGNFVKKIYKDTGLDKTFSVKLTNNESGVQSHIYVVANAGSTAFAADPASEAAFQSVSLNIPTEEGLQLTGGYLPMLGELNLEVNENAVLSQTVDLSRLVARVSLKWSIDPALNSHLKLTSARLCNVPQELYFTAPTDDSVFPATPTLYNGDATDLTVAGTPDSLVYYLPDNRRGTGTNTGGDATGKSGKLQATYIELTGFYNGDRVVYRLYPGADDVNDYNIVRNRDYRMNLSVTGISTADKRVVARTATSNCYLVPVASGSTVYIPVKRANQSTELGEQLPDLGSGWSSSVIWRDNSSLEIETDDTDQAYGIFQVKVNSEGESGNALVCIKDGSNNILWSWHIWVTDFDPDTETQVFTSGGVNYTFMVRNLGAVNDTPGDAGSLGLLYQWGRKDPFAGSSAKTLNNTTLKTLYEGGSSADPYNPLGTTPANASAAPMDVAHNLENSIRNPGVFYYGSASPYDWYIGSNTDQNNTLWGTIKTVYDPCPSGWKVAPLVAFSNWSASSSSWDATNLGRIYTSTTSSTVSWYPAFGYRNSGTGALMEVGTYGFYWSSEVFDTYGSGLRFSSSAVLPAAGSLRASGFALRCVQD